MLLLSHSISKRTSLKLLRFFFSPLTLECLTFWSSHCLKCSIKYQQKWDMTTWRKHILCSHVNIKTCLLFHTFSGNNKHLAIKIKAIPLCKDCSHLVFAVFYKLIPAHNVFVLYISQYLTFALHFVGQGPVTMYNNFIYAIGFSQHFNGFNWIHISLGTYCIHSELNFIDVSLCSVPLRPIALSSFLSRCWGFCASSSLSNSSE